MATMDSKYIQHLRKIGAVLLRGNGANLLI